MRSHGSSYLRLAAFSLFALSTQLGNALVSPTRPKITGISYVRFKSSNFDKSRAFYERTLGMTYRPTGCNGLSNPCFVINPLQHIELDQAKAGEHGSFLSEIGFITTDVNQMHEYLLSRGVQSSSVSRRANGALFLQLDDPEHNHLVFVQISQDMDF